MHRVRHDVRQAREAHRRPRTRRVHAAPPLEGGRHTVVHAPEHSGEQRVAHHHPQRVKGSEHRQEVRQRNGARTLLRRGAWHPCKHAERLHLQDGAQPARHHHGNSRRTRNNAGDRREGAGSGGQRVGPDREGPKQHTLAAAGHRRSVAANDYRLVGSNEVTAVHGHSQLQDGGRIRRVAHPRRVAQHRSPRTAKPARLRRRHRHKAQVRAELRVACPPKRRRQRHHQQCRDGAPTAADVVLRQATASRRRRHGERRARHVAPPQRAAHRRRRGPRGRQRHRLRHLQGLRRPVRRRTVVRRALTRRRRVAQQRHARRAVAPVHVRQVHRQAVTPVPALSTAAVARPRHRPRRGSKAAHVGIAHATRHGAEFPDNAGGPVVHWPQRLPVERQAPHNEPSAGAPERNGAVHHDGPTAGVPVERQRALREFHTARVRRHRQKPAADAVAAHRQPRPGRKRRRQHRTTQRSTAHHVQHGAVQQRHILHNDPHAVPRHPRHVKHRTHAVQHNVAQRHLARAGRHNEHQPHRHALAEKHTRRGAHNGRQHGSTHRHARHAHATKKETARAVGKRRRQRTEARQRSTESNSARRSPSTMPPPLLTTDTFVTENTEWLRRLRRDEDATRIANAVGPPNASSNTPSSTTALDSRSMPPPTYTADPPARNDLSTVLLTRSCVCNSDVACSTSGDATASVSPLSWE
ncbi:hypothetical protein ECC02_009195 [Trypanosoma cruzi]|uniref:Dispersed protein family protein 1 (DGF-1) n=1 Tax=Trypanosoma cruzi TaxID=5693 RepID=A0A7J6XUJ0_TRYCR|nr:hypothetical protein ECC02_009195 [Trypanosoma cruzi]